MLENISILDLFKNAILLKKQKQSLNCETITSEIVENVVLRSCGSRIAAILDS